MCIPKYPHFDYRSAGADPIVSVVTTDDFAQFQAGQNGNGFHDDEEMDFTPQNGYIEPDDEGGEWQGEERGR